MPFYVYILRCRDASYYVGHADDLEVRLAGHQAGSIDGYTAKRRPVSLVFSQECATRDEAFRLERQVKGWSRAKKEALIAGNYTRLRVLARNYRDTLEPRLRQAQPAGDFVAGPSTSSG